MEVELFYRKALFIIAPLLSLITALGFSVFAYLDILKTNSGSFGSASDWALAIAIMTFFCVLVISYFIYGFFILFVRLIISLVRMWIKSP
jgi:hypothetical protein